MAHQSEDYNIALSKFESMLKTNNILFFDSEEFENIIHHYLEFGEIALAKRAIKLSLDQHPSSVTLQLFKVEILVLENKFSDANTILETLHQLEPHNEEVYIQKANVLSKQDKHQEAINTLLIVLDLTKNPEENSDLYNLIGMEYLFQDQFTNAILYFKKCLDYDPQDYVALHNIIYSYDFLDNNHEAILFLNQYLNANPYCEVAWLQLGKQYFTTREYDKAKIAFDFAIISDDTFIGAYIEKGKVLEKLKDYPSAIENYNITLALEEPTSFAMLRIGHCYEKLGLFHKAIKFFTKTVEEDPLLDKGWIAISKFHMKRLDYQKSLYYIKKALNIDSDNVTYWKIYARLSKRLNFLEEAEYGYKRTLELGNHELDTWIERSDILIALGELDAALLNLTQASEFYSENEGIEYRLAGLHFTLLQPNKGYFHLKNAIKLNKDYAFIISELFPKLQKHKEITSMINNELSIKDSK